MYDRPKRSGIMLCYPFEEARLESSSRKAWNNFPVLTQPKLDGIRCRALIDASGQVLLLSSTEEPIVSCPHIMTQLEQSGLTNIELDGELYTHGMPFEEIHSRTSRTTNLHPEYDQIDYHMFDIVNSQECISRLIRLGTGTTEFLKGHKNLHAVSAHLAHSLEDVMHQLDRYAEEGYEGIIVRKTDGFYQRKRSTDIMKFKPRKTDVYKVIGSVEEVDKYGVPKGRLGALVCQGDDQTHFNVGSGFNAEQREGMWELREYLPGQYVRIKYQSTTGKGVPRFPIFAELYQKGG